MPPFVGVTSHTTFDTATAKRDLLLFDQLAIPGLPFLLDALVRGEEGRDSATVADMEWLQKNDLITEATLIVDRRTVEQLRALEQNLSGAPNVFTRLVAQTLRRTKGLDSVALEATTPLEARQYSISMVNQDEYNVQAECYKASYEIGSASPFWPWPGSDLAELWHSKQESPSKGVAQGDALRVTLHEFPQPDDSTSWERLVDFKKSEDNPRHRGALRRWITQVATTFGDPVEIVQELEYLQGEYEAHMRLHKIKIQKGSIETTVVGGARLLEDMAKLKLADAAEQLFTVQHQRLALLDAEAQAPGREITYLVRAREAFGFRKYGTPQQRT